MSSTGTHRMSGALLMTHQDVFDLVIVHGVIEGQRDAARITEHDVHPFTGQTLQQHFRATHQI